MTVAALVNGRVLTDQGFVEGHAVLIEGDRIVDVVADSDSRVRNAAREDLDGGLLLPGFIDTQVNGGGGVLFNNDQSVEGIRAIGAAHRTFGTTGFLPTLISEDLDVVAKAIKATRDAIAARVPGVLGIHIEGPFLNVARKGVHDAAKLRGLDDSAVGLLTSLQAGKTLVTLAPEMTTPEIIERLAASGVVVSAGHTNATFKIIETALHHGVTGFTHLFNAMSQLGNREPGVVGAALDDQNSWCGIIVDGRHVSPVVLRIALRSKRHDRFMLVTDAMPGVGTQDQSFVLQGRKIFVKDGVCIDEDGRLAGSHLDMAGAVRNTVETLGIDLAEAVRMASTYPAEFLGLGQEYGKISRGFRANLVLADPAVTIKRTWIDGAAI
jgi:N-acetylglucosamine-6-phosphate deacetylase